MAKQNLSSTTATQKTSQLKTAELVEQVNTLEIKVAYQERLNQDLSDQVYQLHQEIAELKKMLNQLKEQIQQEQDPINIGPANEAPPHY